MSFSYERARSVEDVRAFLDAHPAKAKILAGGTDLLIQFHRGLISPAHVMDIRRVDELCQLSHGEKISIGSAVTHGRIERDDYFRRRVPALVEASSVVGGWQIRNMGTVGGNLANASPAADVNPVLMSLDAEAHFLQGDEVKVVPLHDFFQDRGKTVLGDDGILTRVTFDRLGSGAGTAFVKAGRRRAMEISVINVAARVALESESRMYEARIVVGAVGPVPFRMPEKERELQGQTINDEVLVHVAHSYAAHCMPRDDVRASAAYRRHLVGVMVERALRVAMSRARESLSNE